MLMLKTLNAYGISGVAENWFKSYLIVNVNKRCGVPQGTILGPLLFLIYIKDLPNCLIHSHARMFADDTSLTYASNNIHKMNHNINEDLANVSEWLSANRLTLNQTKTEFMFIGNYYFSSNSFIIN